METTTSATGRKKPAPKGQQTAARDLTDLTERATGGDSCSCVRLPTSGLFWALVPSFRKSSGKFWEVQKDGIRHATRAPVVHLLLCKPILAGYFRSGAEGHDDCSKHEV